MPNIQYIRLSQLTQQIRQAIDRTFAVLGYWVVADVTNHTFRAGSNMHYFELIEQDPQTDQLLARIAAKAWGSGAQRIRNFEAMTGQPFASNIQALIYVTVQYHPVYGLQLSLEDIDPHYTLGLLAVQRQQVLQQLVQDNPEFIAQQGNLYFTRNKQLPLRPALQYIALISAQTSAGAEDFKHTLQHNNYGYRFTIDDYFTPVQGTANAGILLEKIIDVFRSGRNYDAVVLIRGGGSQTDFLIFDQYQIGKAIAKFPIPIITGIGHQKNETVADLMAHTQTKTPTQAAEFVIAHNRRYEEQVSGLQQHIVIRAQQNISKSIQSLNRLNNTVINLMQDRLKEEQQSLQQISSNLKHAATLTLFSRQHEIAFAENQLRQQPGRLMRQHQNLLTITMADIKERQAALIKSKQQGLNHLHTVVRLLSPQSVLSRGFAMVQHKGNIIANSNHLSSGDEIELIFSESRLNTLITKITNNNEKDPNL